MKLIRHLTWQNMKSTKARTLVTILGIILSAAMFTAVTTMGVSIQSYMIRTEIATNGDYMVRFDYSTNDDLEAIQKEDSVTKLGTIGIIGYSYLEQEDENGKWQEDYIIGAGNKAFFEMIPIHLEEGHLPQNGDQLVITRNAYDYLRKNGQPCEIGEKVTFPIATQYDWDNMELPGSGAPFEKTFTIVGISQVYQYFEDYDLHLSNLLTFDDGSEEILWSRMFAKTAPKDAYALGEKSFGSYKQIHQDLLDLYGISQYANIKDMIRGFAAVLCLIIMVGSVSLIYNAFSISVSERTKQFGLLSSVGATKKQIRQSVLTEALFLSAAGIPLGLISGYGGIALTLYLTHDLIDNFLAGAVENGITIKAVSSVPAFLTAGLIALITVLISAWIPARRATGVAPIAAIRQSQDYKVPKKGIRAGKLSNKLFGLPAALARKYYTVNKRKYRATVISLTISMVLFVSAGTFVQEIQDTVDDQLTTDNFDFIIPMDRSEPEKFSEQVEAIRVNSLLKESAIVAYDRANAIVPAENTTAEYQDAWNRAAADRPWVIDSESKHIRLYYLEDEALRSYLTEAGYDPEPYLDAEHPLALVSPANFTFHEKKDGNPYANRISLETQVLRDGVSSITLIPNFLPDAVEARVQQEAGLPGKPQCDISYYIAEDGIPLWNLTVMANSDDGTVEESGLSYQVEIRLMGDGTHYGYYFRDPVTGEAEAEPAAVVDAEGLTLPIGAAIEELPFGVRISDEMDTITLIYPLSSADPDRISPELAATATDYNAFKAFLDEEEIGYFDLLEDQIQQRNYITMIRIFSYGFITLISLICICNVFNTISTNIALRRKDFGMLRSVGMKNREINQMMAFECLQYGLKAMLWGIPLSIVCSFLISRVYALSVFRLPWQSLAIAAGCIFLTVFITMFYAVSRLRRLNPIDDIRSES